MVDTAIPNAFVRTPETVQIHGPERFLRAAGADNNPYGRWWFEEAVVFGLQEEFERIPIPDGLRREAILGRIRAATAIPIDWNTLSEFWLMEIPAGHSLEASVGAAREQAVFSLKQALHNAGLLLRGGIKQYYFPVINPLWVYQCRSYFDL